MNFKRIVTAFKAGRELGLNQVGLNALYRFGLASGHYRRLTGEPRLVFQNPAVLWQFGNSRVFPSPNPETLLECLGFAGKRALLTEADEIVSGKYRQFGGEPVEIHLEPPGPLAHWTEYETRHAAQPAGDIKLVWEPARFGWAFVLGRAYVLSGDDQYALAFWRGFEVFQKANPPYLGPNWSSGQEVGLRLMAFCWVGQVFSGSQASNSERMDNLAQAIALHAARIPPTLVYARSQNNNHLLTEAAALLTAGLVLPRHPSSGQWLASGWRWLEWCFCTQIDSDGEYVQHSTNYQRLALQIALWVRALIAGGGLTALAAQQLALASNWLLARLDATSGQVPNLGANDGALIFPLACAEFNDYRPVAAACSRAFLSRRIPQGVWDEMSLWFGLPLQESVTHQIIQNQGIVHGRESWGSLRAVHFTSRPSHADQLHCDLWWRGLNIACDPGTYLYNADPPWDNQLTSSLVHNTVTINGQEQMTRAGRFLYLDWAEAAYQSAPAGSVAASTQAYARFGVLHTRTMSVYEEDRWLMRDELTYIGRVRAPNSFRLHWLLPDWDWELDVQPRVAVLRLKSPHGWISLSISTDASLQRAGLVRAGELIKGEATLSPIFGWVSPTYNVKKPALALAVEVQSGVDLIFESLFTFPK